MIFRQTDNELKCYGRIWNGDGVYFQEYFESMQKKYEDIVIRLHTPGGSVIDGNLMFNAVNKATSSVTFIIEGLAASMGSVFIMASDKVKIAENAFIMIHAPSGGANGTAKDLRNTADLLESIQDNFIEKIKERTGLSEKQAKELMTGDNWFDAKKALKLGLVSEIIPTNHKPIKPIDEPENMGSLEVFNAYANLLAEDIPKNDNKLNLEIAMKQLLITAFALQVVTADSSDTAVLEALKSKFTGLENDKNSLEQTKADLEQKLEQFQDKQITAVIEAHARTNKITDEKKEVLKSIGKTSGVDALMTVLETEPTNQAPNINNLIQDGKDNGTGVRANWDWDQWQKEDPRGLEKLATENPEAYNNLFNEKYNK